jgi:Penicillin amidase
MRTSLLLTMGVLGALGCSDNATNTPADAATDITRDATGDATADGGVDGIPAAVAAHPLSEPAARSMGLDGPVDVVYDRMGWPHVYASSLRDAAAVQGYIMARDRMPQMEMLRRLASGTLAERSACWCLTRRSSTATSPRVCSACAAPRRRCGPRRCPAATARCSSTTRAA